MRPDATTCSMISLILGYSHGAMTRYDIPVSRFGCKQPFAHMVGDLHIWSLIAQNMLRIAMHSPRFA
ncbi:unannotated protein [freshwater metagenome]|uniref:Unannotated protein n=1 Tax=freshwater metagenome TaxID=449393 RepID=A0A6J7UQX2_9ZZZZ